MKVNLEERNGQLIPVSMDFENDEEVKFILDQLRPKGEWKVVYTATGETKYKCNQCQHYIKKGDDKNFCPNCGAQMQKRWEESEEENEKTGM